MAICAKSRQLANVVHGISTIYRNNGFICTTAINRNFYSICSSNESYKLNPRIELNSFIKCNNFCSPKSINLTQNRAINIYRAGPRPDPRTEKRNLDFKVVREEGAPYTTKKMRVIRLAGRDPETGRFIYKSRSGGYKKFFRDVLHDVPAPTTEGEFYEERVIDLVKDDFKTALLALVCNGNNLRYKIATTSMKPGDLIKTSGHIPTVAVIPKQGDTYPLGALPIGTYVCCVQRNIGMRSRIGIAAGITWPIKGHQNGKILLQLKPKLFCLFSPECMATVGQVSNPGNSSKKWASINEKRRAGFRPRSGLWQRKTGYHGKKIKPVRTYGIESTKKKRQFIRIQLNCPYFQPNRKVIPSVRRVT